MAKSSDAIKISISSKASVKTSVPVNEQKTKAEQKSNAEQAINAVAPSTVVAQSTEGEPILCLEQLASDQGKKVSEIFTIKIGRKSYKLKDVPQAIFFNIRLSKLTLEKNKVLESFLLKLPGIYQEPLSSMLISYPEPHKNKFKTMQKFFRILNENNFQLKYFVNIYAIYPRARSYSIEAGYHFLLKDFFANAKQQKNSIPNILILRIIYDVIKSARNYKNLGKLKSINAMAKAGLINLQHCPELESYGLISNNMTELMNVVMNTDVPMVKNLSFAYAGILTLEQDAKVSAEKGQQFDKKLESESDFALPEASDLEANVYNEKSMVYRLAFVVYNIWTGCSLHELSQKDLTRLKEGFSIPFEHNRRFDELTFILSDQIKRAWNNDPDERPTMREFKFGINTAFEVEKSRYLEGLKREETSDPSNSLVFQ